MNALVGYERSIVYNQPGTTRDLLTASTIFQGWPVELIDTAGLHETAHPIEATGIALAKQELKQADLILLLIDLSAPEQTPTTLALKDEYPDAVLVGNKMDLVSAEIAACTEAEITISALQQTHLQELIQLICLKILPKQPPPNAVIRSMKDNSPCYMKY